MAISTLFLTGFEHGFVAAAANAGTGLFDTVSAGITASTSSPRNGSYCAHLVAPAATVCNVQKALTGTPTKVVSRFAVKVTSRPSSDSPIAGWANQAASFNQRLLVASTGQLSLFNSPAAATVTGPVIDTTNWHLVEVQIDIVAGTIDWKVDGVAQTRLTAASPGTSMSAMALGPSAASFAAFTADYDDWIIGTWTVAGTDWYGDGKVLGQAAGSDGTHATVTAFSPGDAGTAYAGTVTTAYTMVDDAPGTGGWTATRSTTDNLAMRVANAAAYLAIAPVASSEPGPPNAVRALLSYSSSSATANLAACSVHQGGFAFTLHGDVGDVGADFSENTNFFKGRVIPEANAATTAAVNSLRWRFGGCTSVDVSPIPTCQALMLEVDWPISAVTEQIPSLVMAPPIAA